MAWITHHLLVDGFLKSDESEVNSLSDFSRKARKKEPGIYRYALPLIWRQWNRSVPSAFPGNMLDATAYESFIRENGITKGIIVADKGFPLQAAESEFNVSPDLHYLNTIKRISKLIENHDLHSFAGILSDNSNILYRKEKCSGKDKWLYSYRDAHMEHKEEQDRLARAKKDDSYSFEKL